jgi:large subunit ribosomal protein L25
MLEIILVAKKKIGFGTGVSRALRKQGEIPAVIYGLGKNYKISLNLKNFLKEYQKGRLLSKLVDVKLEKEMLKTIPREVQIDPVTEKPIHVDFQLIDYNNPIKVSILVKAINQDKSPGIKKGGILNVVKKYIDLNCMPKDIPAFLQVDISDFEIGKTVHMHDIEFPNGVVSAVKNNFTILTISGRIEDKDEEKKAEDDEVLSENK